MPKKLENKKCGPGQILKKGYHRKGYQRKEYIRDGTVIKSTHVPGTYVPPTCIKDRGKKGRGPKNLPRPDQLLHLSKYGYSVHKPTKERRAALRAASADNSIWEVEHRLNLIRNLQPTGERAKNIMSQDMEYMKKLYKYSGKHRQTGGRSDLFFNPIRDESDTSDTAVDNVNIPEGTKVLVNTIIDREKICDDEGKCGVRNVVYEEHIVNDRQVIFYTLGEKDVDDILALDKLYLDSDEDRATALEKVEDNPGLLIGIRVDGQMNGYAHYEPLENNEVTIVWFCAHKGYGTPLYQFLERYFKKNDYTKIKIVVSLEGSYATNRVNFWYKQGFKVYKTLHEKYKLHMEKSI